ncbi:Asp23/Gls24 family envelope stress response protein [Mycolicibacterium wolinskyi]|uniref:Alkaline shock protein 23 n=1 Tax=Mycolicibacterium wolinskyi TaxID=59750 RepID=A0A132PU73_9MYCO|nr:Asp23/Gls24 family envelope stress response protein [Mycolicibacterium wolinskyi]KWX25888.1 alkaline shock protein 23 [Mycolicibacterium wolinskyi]
MTTATQTREVSSSANTAGPGKDIEKVSGHGVTTIADIVVSKIAGIATREIDGVYDLGGQAARVVGKLRETLPGSPSLTQGVSVEVGERQAAVDIGIVAEYGVAIHDLAEGIRSNVISAVENMTGLEVTEVNVTVHDVHFADDDDADSDGTGEPRVK